MEEREEYNFDESSYIRGERQAWLTMLRECLKHLGYDNPETKKVAWIAEREEIIVQLRNLCEQFGDNEWDNQDHLGDVIEKHLGRYLEE